MRRLSENGLDVNRQNETLHKAKKASSGAEEGTQYRAINSNYLGRTLKDLARAAVDFPVLLAFFMLPTGTKWVAVG
jgi:hypothetical protein